MSNRQAIVFIDGNNLYHNLKATFIQPSVIHLGKLSDFICEHFGCERIKTIYYNSVPSIADGEEVYYGHMKFLEDVKKLPNFEVKTRKLQRSSTFERVQTVHREVDSLGLCKICLPIVKSHWKDYICSINVREKGIDVMIAIDIIKLGLVDKAFDAYILISGDADFIPVMDLLKNSGKTAFSACTAKGYSYELRKTHGWFILDKEQILKKCSKK
jgi:uncharacterized LabA/DUF88 family protein